MRRTTKSPGFGDLRFVGQELPGPAEQVLAFGRVQVRVAVDPGGEPPGADLLGKLGGIDHGEALLRLLTICERPVDITGLLPAEQGCAMKSLV